ncbi:MAG: hypothetical protein WCQ99_14450 [Pseudomonadota bacterium]
MYSLCKETYDKKERSVKESTLIKESDSLGELKVLAMKLSIEDKYSDVMWLNSPDLNYYELMLNNEIRFVIKKNEE